jgi:hypothetical protein
MHVANNSVAVLWIEVLDDVAQVDKIKLLVPKGPRPCYIADHFGLRPNRKVYGHETVNGSDPQRVVSRADIKDRNSFIGKYS